MKLICIVALIISASALSIASDEASKGGLARLEAAWAKGDGSFTWDYWLVSGAIAEKHGSALIPIVMEQSKSWKGEEVLVYVPLLALLPRDQVLQSLKTYQEGADQKLAMWAGEFLTELEMSDTKDAVDRYAKEKSGGVKP